MVKPLWRKESGDVLKAVGPPAAKLLRSTAEFPGTCDLKSESGICFSCNFGVVWFSLGVVVLVLYISC